MIRARQIVAAAAGAAALLAVTLQVGSVASEPRRGRPPLPPDPRDAPAAPENRTKCNYQEPQAFLIRDSFVVKGSMSREERASRKALHDKTIEYRTKHYGYFEGFGKKAWNPHPPSRYARWTTFFGKRVQLHERIIPAVECVEQQIREVCTGSDYQPQRLSGLRTKNTYHTGEISNHVYGIGLDLDPVHNTCCGCVGEWGNHPLCSVPAKTVYDRMKMPPCWVHTFERFGFYWLGHDPMQDTMHFEFIGDPDRILKAPASAPAAAGGKAP